MVLVYYNEIVVSLMPNTVRHHISHELSYLNSYTVLVFLVLLLTYTVRGNAKNALSNMLVRFSLTNRRDTTL